MITPAVVQALVRESMGRQDALFGIYNNGNVWLQELFDGVYEHVKERTNYYRFLYLLVKTLKPQVAVEIGVEYGVGSAMMAAGNADTIVVGIDPNRHGNVRTIVSNAKNYTFLPYSSIEPRTLSSVQRIVNRHGPIGLVFQDSSHHYTTSHQEFEHYSKLLAPNAVWVCDDITPAFHDPKIDPPGKGMVQYFNELPGMKLTFENELHNGNTMGVVLL